MMRYGLFGKTHEGATCHATIEIGVRIFTVTLEVGNIAGAVVAFGALETRHIRVGRGRLSVHSSPGHGFGG